MFFQICEAQCSQIGKLATGYYNLPREVLQSQDYTTEWFYVDADTTQYCCDIKNVEVFTNPILKNLKTQIINRSNESFYNQLEFEHLIVYYYESKSIRNFNDIKFKLNQVGSINFKVSYRFKDPNNAVYRFELGTDSMGNIISEQMFPDLEKNPNALNIIEPCKAIEIVESDKRFEGKTIKSIKLLFDQIENSFYWKVEEDGEKQIDKKNVKFENWDEFISLNFLINVSSI